MRLVSLVEFFMRASLYLLGGHSRQIPIRDRQTKAGRAQAPRSRGLQRAKARPANRGLRAEIVFSIVDSLRVRLIEC